MWIPPTLLDARVSWFHAAVLRVGSEGPWLGRAVGWSLKTLPGDLSRHNSFFRTIQRYWLPSSLLFCLECTVECFRATWPRWHPHSDSEGNVCLHGCVFQWTAKAQISKSSFRGFSIIVNFDPRWSVANAEIYGLLSVPAAVKTPPQVRTN